MSTYEINNQVEMTIQEKKDKIKALALQQLERSHADMIKKIDKAMNSGAVDPESWSPLFGPMILVNCIVGAILEDEATQYNGGGTSYAKEMKADIKNIRRFI